MAALVFQTSLVTTSNLTAYATAAFTPPANSLLLVVASTVGTAFSGTESVVASANGITFVPVPGTIVNEVNRVGRSQLWIATGLTPPSPVSMTVTYNGSAGYLGAQVAVVAGTGFPAERVGTNAIRNYATAPQITGASNIAVNTGRNLPAFPAQLLPDSPMIGAVVAQSGGSPPPSIGPENVGGVFTQQDVLAPWPELAALTNYGGVIGQPASFFQMSFTQTAGLNGTTLPGTGTMVQAVWYNSPRGAWAVELDPSSVSTGANTPSTADLFAHGPMTSFAATDVIARYSNAVPFAHGPMTSFAATSGVQRAPSIATAFDYGPMTLFAATDGVASRAALYAHGPMTSFAATSTAQWTSIASPPSYALAPVAATSSVGVGVVNLTSIALPYTFPTMSVTAATGVQGLFSTADPYAFPTMAPLAATSVVGRVVTSVADPQVYAPMTPSPATANVSITSNASPATYSTTPSNIDLFFSGITNLYCVADPSNVTVTAGTKANVAYLPRAQNNVATGSGVDGVLSAFWGGPGNITNRTVTSLGNTNPQSHYFGRFVSRPLAGQTIPPQSWNYAAMVGETSANAKTFFAPVMYVWRPSNNTVVGYIFDGSIVDTNEWPAAVATGTRNIAGASVPVQDGDVLVVEAWGVATQLAGSPYLQTWRITDNSSKIASQYKLFYLPTSTLWLTTTVATSSPTAGKKASNLPLAVTGSATTIATEYLWSEVAPNDTNQLSRTVNAQSTLASPQSYYLARYSTAPLAAQTIPAQTWSYEISCSAASANSHTFFWPVIYAWRPSTNQVVGYVFNAAGPAGVEWRSPNDDPRLDQQFAGASLPVLDGDILVIEVWGAGQETTTAGTYLQRLWVNSYNSRVVSPYKLVYYTGLKQSITSDANAAAYDLVENDATSTYSRLIVNTPSVAVPAVFALAPVAATDVAQGYSNALPLAYAFTATAATSTPAYTSNAVPALYALSAPASTATLTRLATALPGAYSQALAANTWDGASYYSNAGPVTYSHAPTAATAAASRIVFSTAVPAAFTLGATPTTDAAVFYSVATPAAYSAAFTTATANLAWTTTALPATYSHTPQAVTVSLGRVYTSVASPTSYFTDPIATGYGFTRIGIASPATYNLAGVAAVSGLASYSVASPANYSYVAQSVTVALGRIYTSVASPTTFFGAPVDTGQAVLARFSNAVAVAYSAAAPAATAGLGRTSTGLQVVYDFQPQAATVYLGRAYTTTALPTNFFTSPVDSGEVLARGSIATPATYSLAAPATTSGVVRIVFAVASPAAYSFTAQDVTAGFVRVVTSNAVPAVFVQQALDAYDSAARSSIALPFVYGPQVGTTTTSGFARSSPALPATYTQDSPATADVLGRTYSSVASPAAFVLAVGFPGDIVARISSANAVTFTGSYNAATAYYGKNSNAQAAYYSSPIPDTWSGRVVYSSATPAPYNFASPATNSYVPAKQVSIALPPAFLVSATASNHRRDYATQAFPAPFVLERWDTSDFATSEIKKPIVFPTPVAAPLITDTQFAIWLSSERAIRVVLMETMCVDPVTGSTELIYFASHGFVTKLEDGAPVFYSPLMRGGLDFAQSLDLDLHGTYSYGDIELDNAGGELDWMFDRVWLYKSIKAFVGDATWPRRDFRQIFDGTIEDIDSSQRDTVNMRIRDKLYRLETPLTEARVAGTGPNADRLVPIVFGECHNVTPVLKDATTLTYVYHAGVAERVIEVRDNGIPVAFTAVAGTPSSFTLSKQPAGRITCSVQGDRTAGQQFGTGYVNTVAAIARRLMTNWGTEDVNRFGATDIDSVNFALFEAANKQPVGLYATERTTVLEACQQVAASVGGRLTMNALGKAQLVKLQLPPPAVTQTVNLQYNGDFSLGTNGWEYGGNTGGVLPDNFGVDLDPPPGPENWYPVGGHAFFAHQPTTGRIGNLAYYFEYLGKEIPVEPNKQYTVSAYTGAHRCKVAVLFYEYDASGTKIASSPLATTAFNNNEKPNQAAVPTPEVGRSLSEYKQVYDTKITSPTTAYIRTVLRKYDTTLASNDSWIFATLVTIQSEPVNIIPIVVTESDIVSGSLHIADRLPLVPGSRLGYCKNWTVQEDTASGLLEEHKALFAREWLSVVITQPDLREKYGLWGEPEQEPCLLLDKTNASIECGRRVDLRATQRHVYEFVGYANLMFTPIGSPMTIIHRRFGLLAGKTGQVVSVAVNWLTSQVTIRVLI